MQLCHLFLFSNT